MPRLKNKVPSYRRHAGGQAFVELNGHRTYLGEYGSSSSKAKYRQLTSEWAAKRKREDALSRRGEGH